MSVTVQRGETFAGYNQLETMSCANCGVLFAIPERMAEVLRENGRSFYCPNGHVLSWSETALDRARIEARRAKDDAARARAAADQARADRDAARRSEQGQRAAKTRIKRSRDRERTRVANGVCPCCNRSFKDLRRHMASKHPEHAHVADD